MFVDKLNMVKVAFVKKMCALKDNRLLLTAAVAAFVTALTGVFLVLGFVFGWFGGGYEAEVPQARVMSVFRVRGDDVVLRNGEREFAAVAGTRLHEGYSVATGRDSFCYIQLDVASLVKVDQQSRVIIDRVSPAVLAILVDEGQVLVDVQGQHPEHEFELRVGNSVMRVRGTLFAAGRGEDGHAVVTMLEGTVETDDGRLLNQGTVTRIYDGAQRLYVESGLLLKEMDTFVLQAIVTHQERLLEAGSVTGDMVETAEYLLERADETPGYITINGRELDAELTVLALDDLGLTNEDIAQLRYMVNLEVLSLTNNQISDITPLAGLTNLTRLFLEYNEISDLTPLAGLTNLTWLSLSNNRISDITPLNGLTNLSELYLDGNEITDWVHVEHVEYVGGRPFVQR